MTFGFVAVKLWELGWFCFDLGCYGYGTIYGLIVLSVDVCCLRFVDFYGLIWI